MSKQLNVHFVTGKVGAQHEHYWEMEAQRQIENREGETVVYT